MKKYDLLAEYLNNISFDSSMNVPALFFQDTNEQARISVNLDIKVDHAENELYLINLIVGLQSSFENGQSIFNIDCSYSGIIHMNEVVDEETLQRILLIDVPQELYVSVKALIDQTINNSGFPPFCMSDVDFEELYTNKHRSDVMMFNQRRANNSLVC